MSNEQIIKKFILTWKSQEQKKNNNVYTFYVDPSSNKFQIREVIENLFNVKIEKLNVSREKPILKNPKRNIYTKLKKKVFVKLRSGYSIGDAFEGKPQNSSSPVESSIAEVKE